MDVYYLALYFYVYGFLGWCAEVGFAAVTSRRFVNRGFLNGPICPIYGVGISIVLAFLTPLKSNIVLLYLFSVVLATLLEGVTGWAMYKIFHQRWWDYSDMPLHIGPYVCLPFSLLWGVLCVLIVDVIHPVIQKGLEMLPHTLTVVVLVILTVILIADICVTSAAIFKFNKHLESMEKIAAELKEISNQIGEDIYEATMTAVEKGESLEENLAARKQASRENAQEVHDRIMFLSERYTELKNQNRRVMDRLMMSFPKMESQSYNEQLEELRRQLKKRRGL